MPAHAAHEGRRRTYVRRDPSRSVLHRVVTGHLRDFLRNLDAREDGPRLPGFVRKEFERFETCGDLEAGFARFRCGDCRAERLVA